MEFLNTSSGITAYKPFSFYYKKSEICKSFYNFSSTDFIETWVTFNIGVLKISSNPTELSNLQTIFLN